VSEFIYYAPKPSCVNDFVGFFSVGKQHEDAAAHRRDKRLGIATAHGRLHDERCRQIDKLSNFPHACGFVCELFRCGHEIFPRRPA